VKKREEDEHRPAAAAARVLAAELPFSADQTEALSERLTDKDRYKEAAQELSAAEGFAQLRVFLCAALKTRIRYAEKGIPDEIFVQTMKCFSRFVGEHRASCGEYGFDRGFWVGRQLSLLLFRLGELEYECADYEGEKALSVHIPSDADLTPEKLDRSFAAAREFFAKYGDGYADYDVTYDDAKYREGNDGEYNDEPTWADEQGSTHYANHVLLRSHNSLDNGLVDVNVTKQWRDGNDQDGLRPASITVKLLRNGQETGSTLTLNADNKWSGIFRELRAYERGEQLVYTVAEVAVPGYTSTITGTAATGFNIMNTHTPGTLTISGTKTWADAGNESARPEKITVILLAGGEQLAEQVVSPDANGKWSWSFENLPKYSAGKAIAYTIDELEVPGYTKKVDGYNITNTYKPAVTPSPSPTPTATPAPTVSPTPTPTNPPPGLDASLRGTG